jgi:hypothetical protein
VPDFFESLDLEPFTQRKKVHGGGDRRYNLKPRGETEIASLVRFDPAYMAECSQVKIRTRSSGITSETIGLLCLLDQFIGLSIEERIFTADAQRYTVDYLYLVSEGTHLQQRLPYGIHDPVVDPIVHCNTYR